MDKFLEEMLLDARRRYRDRWDEFEKTTGELPTRLRCPFCILDERTRFIIFKASEFSAEVPSCSMCPLVNTADTKHVLENCVGAGMKLLEEWEEYFNDEEECYKWYEESKW